eukprot:GGOE01044400.1.p1 GENE.GGOE01044400.1~~GGOE01044400.1.p1  ORF type:complete len:124 (-),score=21.34 GGOE01044400.1:620-961(-)
MVQGSDFSALSAWCRTAKKRKSRPAAKSKPPTSPVLNPPLYAEADGAPRGGAGRKKRVRFAMDSQSSLSSDPPSDAPRLFNDEEDETPAIPLWTLASFHAGPFLLNSVFASRG